MTIAVAAARYGAGDELNVRHGYSLGLAHRLARFDQEARAAAALNRPNTLAVHGSGVHDSGPYVVSKPLERQTTTGDGRGPADADDHAISP